MLRILVILFLLGMGIAHYYPGNENAHDIAALLYLTCAVAVVAYAPVGLCKGILRSTVRTIKKARKIYDEEEVWP